MDEAINRWLHLTAAAVWVGPQLFLVLAAIPALRTIGGEEDPVRQQATRVMVRRFNIMAWSAMALLILTGIGNVFEHNSDSAIDAFDYDFRYAWILTTKLVLVGVTISLTALHSFVIGPRLLEAHAYGVSDRKQLRIASAVVSGTGFLASVAILYLAALLVQPFAFEPA